MNKLDNDMLSLIYFLDNIRIFNYLNLWYSPNHFRFPIVQWIYYYFWRILRLNCFIVISAIIISLFLSQVEQFEQFTNRVFITFSVFTLYFQIIYLSSHTNDLTDIFKRFTKCLFISVKLYGREVSDIHGLIMSPTKNVHTL